MDAHVPPKCQYPPTILSGNTQMTAVWTNLTRKTYTNYIFLSLSQSSSTHGYRRFTNSFPSLTVSSYSSYSVPFIFLPFNIICIPSFKVCQDLCLGLFPCVLACKAILGYLSILIPTTCPNHLKCANFYHLLEGNYS